MIPLQLVQQPTKASRIVAYPFGDTSAILYHSLLNQPEKLDFEDAAERDTFLSELNGSGVETGLDDLDQLLSTDDTAARSQVRSRQERYTADTRSLVNWFSLMTAEVCNLGCSYCIAGRNMDDAASKRSILMPFEIAKAGIDWYHSLVTRTQRRAYVNFSGGEPLANRDVTLRAASYARGLFADFPLEMSINTNATLVDNEVAAHLSANRVAIATSLDGVPAASDAVRVTKAGLGASSRILDGWRRLMDAGCELTGFMATINDKNYHHLDTGIIDFAREWGFSWVRVSYDVLHLLHVPVAQAAERVWSIYQYGRKHGITVEGFWTTAIHNLTQSATGGGKVAFFCGAVLGETISVHPDGRLSACGFSSGNFGNVRQADAFNWDLHRELVSSYYAGARDFCHGCEIEGSCAGGCNISRELSSCNGNDSAIRYSCDLYREMTKRLLLAHFEDEPVAEPGAAADGGRDPGFSEFTVAQRGRRC